MLFWPPILLRRKVLPVRGRAKAAAWALAVLAAVVGVGSGFVVQEAAHAQIVRKNAHSYRVMAASVDDRPQRVYAEDTVQASWEIKATWEYPDGRRHTGIVTRVQEPRPGDGFSIWVDERGAVTGAPHSPRTATFAGAVVGFGVFAVCGCLIMFAYHTTTWTVSRRRRRRWAEDWARVEPVWSGRVRG